MSMSMLLVVSLHVHVSVCMCIIARMPDCQVSDQSGIEMKKTNDAGTSPVPYQANEAAFFRSSAGLVL